MENKEEVDSPEITISTNKKVLRMKRARIMAV